MMTIIDGYVMGLALKAAFRTTLIVGAMMFLSISGLLYLRGQLPHSELNRFQEYVAKIPQNDTKSIVILAYQRSGSTYLGSLFNFDPRAFYVFEPLDALYSSLYGTEPGWNVPSDIVSFSNGTQRPVPEVDRAAVAEFLAALLTCDIDRLPTEWLVHIYWRDFKAEMASALPYSQCVGTGRHVMSPVDRVVTSRCGRRYGERPPEQMTECRQLMTNKTARSSHADRRVAAAFVKHRKTLDERIRYLVNHRCSRHLKSACSSRPLRVVKLVRGTMQSMQRLLVELPNAYVVHLVREPRAVALSRFNYHESARSVYTQSTGSATERLVREASIYCRQVVADVRWRLRLEREFPGRLYSLTYEQLVDDPVGRASDIYRFIGETPDESVLKRFGELSASRRRSPAQNPAIKWIDGSLENRDSCLELWKLYPEFVNVNPDSHRFHTPRII